MARLLLFLLLVTAALSPARAARVAVGQPLPAFSVTTVDGKRIGQAELRGKRILYFMWASWWACREQLPVWQSFYDKNKDRNFELVGIAMDAAAPGRARELYQKAGVTFIRGLDRSDMLFETLDFEVVPNGVFVDENGIVRYAKFGGFEVRDDNDRAAIEALLAKPSSAVSGAKAPTTTPAAPRGPAGRWFRMGVQALEKGDKEKAAQHWRKAVELDPANFVIRKQIWALEHPEQFYPAINSKWQREQLAKERAKK